MNKLYLLFLPVLFACKLDVKGPGEKDEDNSSEKTSISQKTKTKIRNDIQLETTGDVKVSQAFLIYEDGKLVPADNKTEVGKPVNLRLIIDDGWKEEGGDVSIGASERIETSDGQVMLDEKDLFKDFTTISSSDARILSLSASISRLDKLYDYFLVSFRVWDKNGPGEIKGNYRFYIQ